MDARGGYSRRFTKPTLLACAITFFFSPLVFERRATAYNNLDIEILITHYSSGSTYYNAQVEPQFFPFDSSNRQHIQFQTGLITSADGQYAVTTAGGQGGWIVAGHFPATFTDFTSLLNSLDQPFSMTLDSGLPTERHYPLSLNFGDLATTSPIPLSITSPGYLATVSTLTPTITFSSLNYSSNIALRLSGPTTDYDLPANSTQWTAPEPLKALKEYRVEVFAPNGFPQGFGFSAPIDATGAGIEGWGSRGSLYYYADSLFKTPVPEPNIVGLIASAYDLSVPPPSTFLATPSSTGR